MAKFLQGTRGLKVHALLATLFIGFAACHALAQQAATPMALPDNLAAGQSLRALQADVNAAIGQIQQSLSVTEADPALFKLPAQAAINALVGAQDPDFQKTAASPPKTAASPPRLGALPDLDQVLTQAGDGPWSMMLGGVEPNIHLAVEDLKASLTTRDFYDFQIKSSRALVDLEMALGHGDEADGLAGINGALGGTILGVAEGAVEIDACKILSLKILSLKILALKILAPKTPAPNTPASLAALTYGIKDGRIAFLAVPTVASEALTTFPAGFAMASVQAKNGYLLIQTPFGVQLAPTCASSAPAPLPAHQQGLAAPLPTLFTLAQARAGKSLFRTHCVTCHGVNLLGVAAPSVAGTDFLTTAAHNGWTLQVIRLLVVQNMPFDNPGSLEPSQYAELLAYILASNCYPAGETAFPQDEAASFASLKLGPTPTSVADPKTGICPVN